MTSIDREGWLGLSDQAAERLATKIAEHAGCELVEVRTGKWEHACGAGASTLFRWGDDCPTDRYPIDGTPGPHRPANAFGLQIAGDPYRAERTSRPEVVCGGDGGTRVHHEAGFFVCWLTLATSFRDAEHGAWTVEHDEEPVRNIVRPVIPLD